MSQPGQDPETETRKPAMRLIVPLQGVVQGRGGLILGSLIPCALFYFLQFYLKRHRSPSPPTPPPPSLELSRTASRSNLAGGREGIRVSARAVSVLKPGGDSAYYVGLERAVADPYHDVANPDGVVQLGLAENTLTLDLIENWFLRNWSNLVQGEADKLGITGIATYQPFDGLLELKEALAGFMFQIMGGQVNFQSSQLVLTSGATPAIEMLSFCLADQGNAFLVPTPYYPGFDRDMRWRTGVELIPVHCRSSDNFTLSITALEQAYNQARKRGQRVRGVLISNPSNPVGNILTRETLYSLLDFARDKNIHIISDELFAGSTYGNENFVSMAEIVDSEDLDKSRVHIIYGLSKDLCIPGFRVGALYSMNEHLITAAKRLTRFSSISTPTQRLLIPMLKDTQFMQEYISTNKKKIRFMYDMFVNGLKRLGIECAKSSGGLYCWADMSKYIRPYNEKGELELWDKLLTVGKVNVTPGSSCHCIEPGWFRCCFTSLSANDIPLVVERIGKVIETCNPNS